MKLVQIGCLLPSTSFCSGELCVHITPHWPPRNQGGLRPVCHLHVCGESSGAVLSHPMPPGALTPKSQQAGALHPLAGGRGDRGEGAVLTGSRGCQGTRPCIHRPWRTRLCPQQPLPQSVSSSTPNTADQLQGPAQFLPDGFCVRTSRAGPLETRTLTDPRRKTEP